MGIFKAFFLISYTSLITASSKEWNGHRNGLLVNYLAISISFSLLLISIIQCFHLFLKFFMIKINRVDIFNMIIPCAKKRTYMWSNFLIICFYYLIKILLVIGIAPQKKVVRERSCTTCKTYMNSIISLTNTGTNLANKIPNSPKLFDSYVTKVNTSIESQP